MVYRRLAAFAHRHSRGIIAIWLSLAAIAAVFALRLPSVLGDHGLMPQGAYAQTQRLISDAYPLPDAERTVAMLFDNDRQLSREQFSDNIARVIEEVSSIPGIQVIASPAANHAMMDGRYAYALFYLSATTGEQKETITRIAALSERPSGMKVSLTGKPIVQLDVNRSSERDLMAAEAIGLPVALALLVFTFGGIFPALVPIVSGLIAVTVSMAVLYVIGAFGLTELSVFVHNVVPMVGMAVCVDFALLLVSRFREEAVFLGVRKSLANTMAASGRAIAISAVCVVLALLGTLFIRMPMFASVALGAIVVVLVSLLVNLTFVPALLCALSDRLSVDRSIFRRRSAIMRAIIHSVTSRPRLTAMSACFVLFLCMLPAHSLRLAVPGPESLPEGTPSRAAAETIAERFGRTGESQAFLIADKGITRQVERELARDPSVSYHESAPIASDIVLFTIGLRGNAASDQSMQWMRERGDRYERMGVLVGGEAKYEQEVHDEIIDKLIVVLTFVIVSNYLVLACAFRSLLIPAKAILMNLLSITASLGIVVWLFQDGRLGLPASDIAIMIPIFVFGLAFGVSMDYGVFLLTRIEEVYRQSGDNELAVREGLAASSRLITSAAAIMIAVTAPFALAGVTGVKQLGIGIAAALFIDATIVRLILVPALMKLFDRWNWLLPLVRS